MNATEGSNTKEAKDENHTTTNEIPGMNIHLEPPELNEAYWKAKEAIVAAEQHVLRVLQFDVMVSHPHRMVVLIFDDLVSNHIIENFTKEREKNMIAAAWGHLNGALFHAPTLALSPMSLACSAVCLDLQIMEPWWKRLYGVTDEELEAGKQSLLEARDASGALPTLGGDRKQSSK
mmetsp:Transcript_27701/g.64180  ORF Transcript_27701/g.64180 Transcript_27701/m.64180 type:complete len:176 (+) Transcript_27701:2-529(+)